MIHQILSAWISIGSTYTYLTAMRIKALQQEKNLQIEVIPISIRKIMREMDNIPFPPSKESKVRHMWRDIERRAELYGLPIPKAPAHFDNFELGGHLVKAVELKSKTNIRMPLKIWQTGLEHGLGRIIRESLLEQLTGQREKPEAFELSTEEPIEKASTKSRFLASLVA